ncbi:MAG: Lrp/AsnC ligand binding domain-containing protein [Ornithinimicrobium sp.]
MVEAYILVQTQVGQSSAVARAIQGVAGVASADEVAGPYDVIARIQAASVDDLGRLVIAQIQDVPHITRTTTCTVVHFS